MNVRDVANRAAAEASPGLNRPYFTREEILALFLTFQDNVVAGLKQRQVRASDYLQADAYEQAARIVLSTPLSPKEP